MKKVLVILSMFFILASCGKTEYGVKKENSDKINTESININGEETGTLNDSLVELADQIANINKVNTENIETDEKKNITDIDTISSNSGNNDEVKIITDLGHGLLLKGNSLNRSLYLYNYLLISESLEDSSPYLGRSFFHSDMSIIDLDNKDFLILGLFSKNMLSKSYVIDIGTKKIYETGKFRNVKKVKEGTLGLYIQAGSTAGGGELSLTDKEGKKTILFKLDSVAPWPGIGNYISDFELLKNKKVKVIYDEGDGVKKEKILDLNEIL